MKMPWFIRFAANLPHGKSLSRSPNLALVPCRDDSVVPVLHGKHRDY
jgi:hypothetical protein